ncbi:MAG TPA: carboxymuconolactone decarboxylase family protein [Burkholderiales bacterium]|jgi:AhpD family alkylhydroperoxidase|nr:carboxymuconolactone decarboxylase family protein [Burkholderiales bacterium]
MTFRVPEVEPGTRPELAEQEARIAKARGRVSALYKILINSPAICDGWEQMLSAVRNKSSLNAAIREMIILRVAVLNGASYEFEAHIPHAQKAGMSDAKIEALKQPAIGSEFSDLEQAILSATDTLTKDVKLTDAQFDRLRPHFNPGELVEVMATIGAYNMVSRFLIAMNIVGKH